MEVFMIKSKMRPFWLFICFSIILASAGCGGRDNSPDSPSASPSSAYNPFDDFGNTEGEVTNAEFSFGTDVQSLTYSGSTLIFDYDITNGSVPCEVGVYIVLNGILHRFSTDISDEINYMHSFSLDKNETVAFKVNLEPVVGKSGETLVLNTAAILNPSFVPETEKAVYGNNLRISSGGNIAVTFRTDAKESEFKVIQNVSTADISQDILDAYKAQNRNFDEASLIFQDLTTVDDSFRKVLLNNKLRFTAAIFGGAEKTYRVYLFYDNQPVPLFGGSDYAEMPVQKGKMSSVAFEADPADIPKGATVYAIAFPVTVSKDDYSVFPIQSPCYYFSLR
jgi:hypothetical protein